MAKMPLMVTGGFRSRSGMNEALSAGDVDVIGLGRPLCLDANFPAKILDGEIEAAQDYERGLRLGPGIFGPNSPVGLLKVANGFAKIGWYYEQIYRLADGLETEPELGAWKALFTYDRTEKAKAAALIRG